jgi:hypothetical protein
VDTGYSSYLTPIPLPSLSFDYSSLDIPPISSSLPNRTITPTPHRPSRPSRPPIPPRPSIFPSIRYNFNSRYIPYGTSNNGVSNTSTNISNTHRDPLRPSARESVIFPRPPGIFNSVPQENIPERSEPEEVNAEPEKENDILDTYETNLTNNSNDNDSLDTLDTLDTIDRYESNITNNINDIYSILNTMFDNLQEPNISIEFSDEIITNSSGIINRVPLQNLTNTLTASLQTLNRSSTNSITDINEQSSLVTLTGENCSQFTDTECSICNVLYNRGDIIRTFNKCPHYYHYECIDTWLHTHKNCPVCTIDII